MNMAQAAQAPIAIEVGNEKISIPKMTLGDFVAWGNEFDQARESRATAGMPAIQKFRVLTFYSILPTTMEELRQLASTPDGIKRIFDTCLARAKVTARLSDKVWSQVEPSEPISDATKELIVGAPAQEREWLAILLADARRPRVAADPNPKSNADPDATLAHETKASPSGDPLTFGATP